MWLTFTLVMLVGLIRECTAANNGNAYGKTKTASPTAPTVSPTRKPTFATVTSSRGSNSPNFTVLSTYALRGDQFVTNSNQKLSLRASFHAPGAALANNVSYRWSTPNISSSPAFLSAPCLLSLAAQPLLIIRDGCLLPGKRYVFRITRQVGSESATTGQLIIDVNNPPSGGKLNISPKKGTALQTRFGVHHTGWTDVDGDLPVSYTSYYLVRQGSNNSTRRSATLSIVNQGNRGSESSSLLGPKSINGSYWGVLPGNKNTTVVSHITDSLGAVARAIATNITVTAVKTPVSSLVSNLRGLNVSKGSLSASEFSTYSMYLQEASQKFQASSSASNETMLKEILISANTLLSALPSDPSTIASQAASVATTLYSLTSNTNTITTSTQALAVTAVSTILTAIQTTGQSSTSSDLAPLVMGTMGNLVTSGALTTTGSTGSTTTNCSSAISDAIADIIETVFQLSLSDVGEGEAPTEYGHSNLTLTLEKRNVATASSGSSSSSSQLSFSPGLISSLSSDGSSLAIKTVTWGSDNHRCTANGTMPSTSSTIASNATVGQVVSIDLYSSDGTALSSSSLSHLPSPVNITLALPSFANYSTGRVDCRLGIVENFTITCHNEEDDTAALVTTTASCDGTASSAVYTCPPSLVCSFYDETLGMWSTEGCTTVSVDDSGAVCQCTHLTDFTLLDAPIQRIKTSYENGSRNIAKRWQRSITILFILCLVCGVFFYSMLRRQWTQERDKFYLVESIRGTPFYWDVLDRFEAKRESSGGSEGGRGSIGRTGHASGTTGGRGKTMKTSDRDSTNGSRGTSATRRSDGGHSNRFGETTSHSTQRSVRNPVAGTQTVRGGIESWSIKDLATDAMLKTKQRLMALVDGMSNRWWASRSARVEDELMVSNNVTRLSIHQKTLAIIIEAFTVFTLSTILRSNTLSVARVVENVNNNDWQGLLATLAPAIQNGVVSVPLNMTVNLVLMHMNKKSRLSKGAREDVVERQRGYTQLKGWKTGPPELYVPGIRLSIVQLKLIKVVLTHDLKTVEPASVDAIVLHKHVRLADSEVAKLQVQLGRAARRIREQPESFGLTQYSATGKWKGQAQGSKKVTSGGAFAGTRKLAATVTKRLKTRGLTGRIWSWLSSLSTDFLATLNPAFWGNPMEFFDKELRAARLLDDFMLLRLWSSWRLIEFSFYELLVANRSTLNDLTGTNWDILLCDVGLSFYLMLCATWVFIFGVGVGNKEAGLVMFSFFATMVANALVVSPTMGWFRLWITVRISRRIQGDLRRYGLDFVEYCEDNMEIKSRKRRGSGDSSSSSEMDDDDDEVGDDEDEAAFVSGLNLTSRAAVLQPPPLTNGGGSKSSKVAVTEEREVQKQVQRGSSRAKGVRSGSYGSTGGGKQRRPGSSSGSRRRRQDSDQSRRRSSSSEQEATSSLTMTSGTVGGARTTGSTATTTTTLRHEPAYSDDEEDEEQEEEEDEEEEQDQQEGDGTDGGDEGSDQEAEEEDDEEEDGDEEEDDEEGGGVQTMRDTTGHRRRFR